MGISVSDAVRMLLGRVVAEKALPFDVKIPNATTVKAMRAADRGGKGSGWGPRVRCSRIRAFDRCETWDAEPSPARREAATGSTFATTCPLFAPAIYLGIYLTAIDRAACLNMDNRYRHTI